MKRVLFLKHVPFEGPAGLLPFFAGRGDRVSEFSVYQGLPFPQPDSFDILVIMGGPMSVHDEDTLPWLRREKDFVRETIAAGKKILGVCLGAQLLAEVLGGSVSKNPEKEIGFFDVQTQGEAGRELFGTETFRAFHWHGETFSIPPGAVPVAASAACKNQAFLWEGRVLGLQFHLETTTESMELLIQNCGDECCTSGRFVQSPEEMRGQADFAVLAGHMATLLRHYLAL